MEARSKNSADGIHCLKCRVAVSVEGHGCTACGYTLEGVRLYDPKHFVLLTFLLTAMVPIFLAASNWGRTGDGARKRRWLMIGFVCYLIFFGAVIVLPDLGTRGVRFIAYLINLPIGWLLRDIQRPVYKSALALGAKPASTFMGSIKGLGITLMAGAIPAAGFMSYLTIEESRAQAFLQEDQYEQAEAVYERLLVWNAEDENIKYNLALCHLCMERWEDAAEGFRAYLQRHDNDPVAHAFLGYALEHQGLYEEAERHYVTAEKLDPEVLTGLFGPE